MDVCEVKLDDIKEYALNAKKHTVKQVSEIANSIKKFGFRQPLVIDSNYEIVIGHGRFMAARILGLETVPCVMADDLTEEQIKALRIVDNKTNESEWDFDLLRVEIASITDIDMTTVGFDMNKILSEGQEQDLLNDLPERTEAAKPTIQPVQNIVEPVIEENKPVIPQPGEKTGETEVVNKRAIILYRTQEEENYLKKLLRQDENGPLPVLIDVLTLM